MQFWYDVTHVLPKERQIVICASNNEVLPCMAIYSSVKSGGHKFIIFDEIMENDEGEEHTFVKYYVNVTHWMEAPNPPSTAD